VRAVRNYLKIGGIYGHALLNQSKKQRKKSTVIYYINQTHEKSIEKDNPLSCKR